MLRAEGKSEDSSTVLLLPLAIRWGPGATLTVVRGALLVVGLALPSMSVGGADLDDVRIALDRVYAYVLLPLLAGSLVTGFPLPVEHMTGEEAK